MMLYSGGGVSYQDLMTMPVPTLNNLISRLNKRAEDQAQARKAQR